MESVDKKEVVGSWRRQPDGSMPRLTPCNNNALRKATRNLGQLFDDVVGPIGLRSSQLGILIYIDLLAAPTMKTLARELVMDLSALGHTLKPLVRDGYVELTPDEEDRRCKRVRLTAAGEAKCAEGRKLWRVAQARFETTLGAEKARVLREVLTTVASEDFSRAFVSGEPLA